MAEYREPTNSSYLEADVNLSSINQPINRELVPRVDETVLIENREELTKQLEPTHILNSLFQRRVIDSDDFDCIRKEERQHGRRAGVEKLLHRIHFSGPEGLDKFIDSLESSGYPGLANTLLESRQIITKRTEQEKANKPCVERKSNYSHRSEIIEKGAAAAEPTTNDTRCIILLGPTGVDKSLLGNYLLGAKIFNTIRTEERCQIERTDKMVVLNTPWFLSSSTGFVSRSRSGMAVYKDIMKTIGDNNLLINVYILVLGTNERMSDDCIHLVISLIQTLFGEDVINNMIIVFTGKDSLKDDEFQFPRCLPQLPYFILDCEHTKQEEVEEIRKEIFSQKFENIPDVCDVEDVDLASIEIEDRDSQKLKNRPNVTQTDGNKSLTPEKILVKEITEKGSAVEPTTNDTRCIILLGESGIGKSSLGNYLLGAKIFNTIRTEERCQIERTDNMVVLNTPWFLSRSTGFFSRSRSGWAVCKEIMNTIRDNNLLINVYILVLEANKRMSDDCIHLVISLIKTMFGEDVINNMIIVFTGKDSLKDDEFQFPRCLPQIPYFILDCEHLKEEEVEKIQKEIFSQKYKNIPDVRDWSFTAKGGRSLKKNCALS